MKASIMKSVVLAVAVVAGASGCGSGGAVDLGAASDHVPAAKYLPKHVAGLPPDGAQPSTPPTGPCLTGGQFSPVGYDIYADGLMIWQKWTPAGNARIIPKGADAISTGLVQQRLTPRGARLLRSRIHATGLFRPGRLPAWAWADHTVRPYIPSHYALVHDRRPPDPSRLPPPANAALAQYTGFLQHGYQIITLNQALALADAFLKAGIAPSDHLPGGQIDYNLAGMHMGPDNGGLELWPALPGVIGPQC